MKLKNLYIGGFVGIVFCVVCLRKGRFRGCLIVCLVLGQIGIWTSSHGNHFNDKLFRPNVKEFSGTLAISGLTMMPARFKKDSFELIKGVTKEERTWLSKLDARLGDLALSITNTTDLEILLVALSNDYKAFVTNHLGRLIELTPSALKKWAKMGVSKRAVFNAKKECVLTKSADDHINEQFEIYAGVLLRILSKSNVKVFHHSSVLERIHKDHPDLGLYFAILNSKLKYFMQKWNREGTFRNKSKEVITCNFVDVRDQFHGLDAEGNPADPLRLFLDKEIRGESYRELTHRTYAAMFELIDKWKAQILA